MSSACVVSHTSNQYLRIGQIKKSANGQPSLCSQLREQSVQPFLRIAEYRKRCTNRHLAIRRRLISMRKITGYGKSVMKTLTGSTHGLTPPRLCITIKIWEIHKKWWHKMYTTNIYISRFPNIKIKHAWKNKKVYWAVLWLPVLYYILERLWKWYMSPKEQDHHWKENYYHLLWK